MSIWLLIASVAYILGAIIQWFQFSSKFKELDEYTNFPIVWLAKLVTVFGCFIEALTWPCSLILGDEFIHQKDVQ